MGQLTQLDRLSIANRIDDDTGESLTLPTGNGLVGTIPTYVGLMVGLSWFRLYGTFGMAGSIPTEVALLTNLKVLELQRNQHTGTLPAEIFDTLSNLESLELQHNRFSGAIPVAMSDLKKLDTILLYDNDFVGEVTTEICDLSFLQELDVDCDKVACSCCKGEHCCSINGNTVGGPPLVPSASCPNDEEESNPLQ